MGNRFGRNQKRKMRRQVEDLERKASSMEKNSKRIRGELDFVYELVGSINNTLETTDIDVNHPESIDHFNYSETPDLGAGYVGGSVPAMDVYVIQELSAVRLEEIRACIRGIERFRFSVNGSPVGYAVTQEAVSTLSDDFLIGMITEGLAPIIAQKWKEHNKSAKW